MFILSLAIADLTVGLIVMPISSAYVLIGDWIFGIIVCQLWLVIDYTASTASIFNLLILSLDRYWSIRYAFVCLSFKEFDVRNLKNSLLLINNQE